MGKTKYKSLICILSSSYVCSYLQTWCVLCVCTCSLDYKTLKYKAVSHHLVGYRWEVWRVGGMASLVAQLVKNLSAMQEAWVQSLGWEDPLGKGKATHSSILAWRIPWSVPMSQRVRHD